MTIKHFLYAGHYTKYSISVTCYYCCNFSLGEGMNEEYILEKFERNGDREEDC